MTYSKKWIVLAMIVAVGFAIFKADSAIAEQKKSAKMGTEALTMSDAKLFPDLLPAPEKHSPPAGYSGDVKKGIKLFSSKKKGNCAACHCTANIQGCGDIGPSLDAYTKDLGEGKSHEWIFQQVADARINTEDTAMPPSLTTGTLTAEEIADIVAYLESVK